MYPDFTGRMQSPSLTLHVKTSSEQITFTRFRSISVGTTAATYLDTPHVSLPRQHNTMQCSA